LLDVICRLGLCSEEEARELRPALSARSRQRNERVRRIPSKVNKAWKKSRSTWVEFKVKASNTYYRLKLTQHASKRATGIRGRMSVTREQIEAANTTRKEEDRLASLAKKAKE